MENMLYDVYKDAIEKLAKADSDELTLITDAITNVITLAELARREGLLSLEEIVQCMELDYAKLIIMQIVDGIEPIYVLEIGTNEYWSQAPQGIWAMVYYIYLRGSLMIQEGEPPKTIKAVLWTLIPAKWRQSFSKIYQELLVSMSIEQKKQEVIRAFSDIHPTFEKRELLKKLSILEKKVMELDNESIQKVLQKVHNEVLVQCLYGFHQEAREKILDNFSGFLDDYLRMEDVVFMEVLRDLGWRKIKEADILTAVLKMTAAIDACTI